MKNATLLQPALPSLHAVKTVEKFIRDHSGEYKKMGIWNDLSSKMSYRIFNLIFNYFEETHHIARDRYGTVGWVRNPDFFITKHLIKPNMRGLL